MQTFIRRLSPFLFLLIAFSLVEAGITADYADARSRSGGRSFKRSAPKKTTPAPSQVNKQQSGKSGFGRGLAGGLLGGALGGMLFGSMFGMGGSGMGILPLLLLGVIGYIFYRKFVQRPSGSSSPGFQPPPSQGGGSLSGFGQATDTVPRDLSSYGHLLGDALAAEYEQHFNDMRTKGEINKLESIAVRKVEIVDAGSDGREDFLTVLFTANLLDYTVDEASGDVKSGSMTEPVKFAE